MRKKNIDFESEMKNSQQFLSKVSDLCKVAARFPENFKGYQRSQQVDNPSEYLGQVVQIPCET